MKEGGRGDKREKMKENQRKRIKEAEGGKKDSQLSRLITNGSPGRRPHGKVFARQASRPLFRSPHPPGMVG